MKRIVAVTLVYLKTGEKATPNKVLKLQHKIDLFQEFYTVHVYEDHSAISNSLS